MDLKGRREWKKAEWEYGVLVAGSMLPMFCRQITNPEFAARLREVLENCPDFYPARLDLAVRLLAEGGNKQAERQIMKGVETILGVEKRGDAEELIDRLVDSLERLWRYDLCRRLLKRLVKRNPDNAAFHDGLAHAEARLGETASALRHVSRAVELMPASPHYRSNFGWILLIAGRVKEAGPILKEARRLDPKNKVTLGNLEVHRYLLDHGGTYFDFLMRPADLDELERLADAEDWEAVNDLCESYNRGRIEAMAQCLLQDPGKDNGCLSDTLATLSAFFRFLEGLVQDAYFLYEDLTLVDARFKQIMHKFIVKHGDVDRELIESIYRSLFEFYGFLAGRRLVSRTDFTAFRKNSLGMKRELIAKMERYNKVRHDEEVGEEEKTALREEIFEGDAFWPHL